MAHIKLLKLHKRVEIGHYLFLSTRYTNIHPKERREAAAVNPLRPNSDLSQTSHCNIMGLSVSEVIRIGNVITQVKFY